MANRKSIVGIVKQPKVTKAPSGDIKAADMKMRNALSFGRFSFDLEEKREQSIITQSSHMLTAFSLFSAALLMAIPIVIDHTSIPDNQVLSAAGLSFITFIASLILTIVAQWRFKYQTMKTAEQFRDEILSNESTYQYQSQYDYQWIIQITEVQKSKKKNNDRRVGLIKAAMICFLVAVGILVGASILFTILYV